jgi:hypothetical protein
MMLNTLMLNTPIRKPLNRLAVSRSAATRYALVGLLLLALPAVAAPPQRVQLDFTVTSGDMQIGEGRDVLVHDGKQYSVVSESNTVGVAAFFYKLDIRRESKGLVLKKGLRPLSFAEDRSRKPLRTAAFDWDAMTITLRDGDTTQTLPLPANTFDQTSFAYAFAFNAPSDESVVVYLTDGRKLSDYNYRMVGKESVKTPMGELQTLHYQKVRAPDDKRGFEIWLAVDHYYFPVKIRYVEKNGTAVDSTVTKITYR